MSELAESQAADAEDAPSNDDLRAGLVAAIGMPFVSGNAIDTLVNGDRIFPAMLDAIRGAERRVEFLTFIYWTGDVAQRFAEAMSERARAGVEVFVMLDGFGGKAIDDQLIDEMQEAGVEVRWFRPLTTWHVWRDDNRTHRKLLIVDGETGFTGGVGIAEEWEGDARDETEWRDNHYRVRGPVVASLRAAFFDNWIDSTKTIEPLTGCLRDLDEAGSLEVQPVISNAQVGWSAVALLQETMLLLAKRRVRIATPYFAPREEEVDAMVAAIERGVTVEVIIPGPHIDKRVSQLASAEAIDRLIEAGADIHRFQPSMFHHKLISVDGICASIGSANFNMRSQFKDDELALNVWDAGFCAEADGLFDQDLKRSERIDRADWKNRGAVRRMREAASRALRHQA